MQDFTGKVAVITGAASGIGRALTEKCLAEGMQVVMADIEEKALQQAVKELQSTGQNAILPVKTNVAILDEIENLKQQAWIILARYICCLTMPASAVVAMLGTAPRRIGNG